jgi:hypothetical protein
MLFRKSATLQPILLIQVSLAQDSSAAGADGRDTTVDYPTYNQVPAGLSFSCSDRLPGYYADPGAQCQVSCLLPQDELRQVSLLFICTSFKIKRTRGGAVGWGTALQVGKSRVWFPMVSL